MKKLAQFIKDENGATAIEYGILASFIFLAIIASVQTVAPELVVIFNDVIAGLQLR